MTRPDQTPLDDTALDQLFDLARSDRAQADEALLARVAADASAVQAEQHAKRAAPPVQKGLFASLAELVGGWPALGGLATAAIAGVYIGFSSPDLVVPSVDEALERFA